MKLLKFWTHVNTVPQNSHSFLIPAEMVLLAPQLGQIAALTDGEDAKEDDVWDTVCARCLCGNTILRTPTSI